jgi:hypothetical protein
MRYRCEYCGHQTDSDGDQSTNNTISQRVCPACQRMPQADWAANSLQRRQDERASALDGLANGSFAPGTVIDMDAWRAARSAGATSAEATQAAAEPALDLPAEESSSSSPDDPATNRSTNEVVP